MLGSRFRQVPAAFEVRGLELRALREVLGGRVRQVAAVCKIRGRLCLTCAFRGLFVEAGERAPDRECSVLLK